MTWLRKYNKQILLGTFCAFILGSVVFGSLQGFLGLSPFSPVLVVNGEKVPYQRYQSRLQQNVMRQDGEAAPDADKMAALKASTLQELAQETVFLQEADRYGITATDNEVAAFLQSQPAFQRDGRFDQNAYMAYIGQVARTSPTAFEEEQRRFIKRQKLVMLLSSGVKVSAAEAREHLARLPDPEKKALGDDFEKLRSTAARQQGNAVFQAWIQKVNGRLKVESRLDRWEKRGEG